MLYRELIDKGHIVTPYYQWPDYVSELEIFDHALDVIADKPTLAHDDPTTISTDNA